jgi:predicted DNA-binding transcriptional regulator AlpA
MLNTSEAAKVIGKSTSWLNHSRSDSSGPVFLKIGGAVRYQMEDLQAWLRQQRRTATYDHANDSKRAAARPKTTTAPPRNTVRGGNTHAPAPQQFAPTFPCAFFGRDLQKGRR